MTDNWEDWENEDFVIPVLSVQNKEQLKQLEERKLVEESDNLLTKSLFSNEEEDFLCVEFKKNEQQTIINSLEKSEKAPKKVSNQQTNEQKQQFLSKKNKENKLRKAREKEVFGEAEEDDEYAKYDDMFY